jgi:ribonuclease HI
MDLLIHFDCVGLDEAGTAGLGVVITDRRTARAIHEVGCYLGPCGSPHGAQIAALVRALEMALPLQPERLELRCCNELLVRQLTGGASVAIGDSAPLEQAVMQLLRVDSWQIGLADPADNQRARQLAQQAVDEAGDVTALHHDDAQQQQRRDHTGVPQWTLTLAEDPGPDCPAGCAARRAYPFGPDVPGGLCVYAALVGLTDGPLVWDDPQQRRMTSVCPQCEVPIEIDRVD